MTADRASAVQRGMYLAAQLDPDSAEYTVSSVTRLSGDLDTGALRAALAGVVARHDILRTGFTERDGTVVAQLNENGQAPFEVVDLPFDQARRALEAAAHRPFDLGKPPLVRALLIRTAPDDHLLQIDLHHAVCDGWSVRLILDEIAVEYDGGLPPLSRPYEVHDEADDEDLAHWQEQLRGVRPVELPPATGTDDTRSLRFELDADLLDAVDALARDAHTTRFVVLLSAFQAVLARWCGTEDVAVGTTVSQRDTPELEQLIGPLFTTVVLRGDLSGDPSFTALLHRTTTRVFESVDHCRTPFEVVLEHTRAGAASDVRNPLFNVLFELDHEQEQHLALSGVDCSPFPIDYFTSKADLGLSFAGRTGTLSSRAGRVDAPAFAERYLRVLRAVTADPALPLSALTVLTGPETAAVERFVDGGVAELPELCVHELFEQQALRTPDAVAVRETGGGTLSYAELDAAAASIAGALAARGVRPETRVAVRVRRGASLLAALLGVWKAGGAYVPLDPSFPKARQRFVVADAECSLVLADEPVDLGAPVLRLSEAAEGTAPAHAAVPGNLCWVIHTSGSTGTPKGLLVEHRGVVNFLRWCVDRYAGERGGAPVFSSVAFDMVVPNLFTPLLVGQAVTIVPETVALPDLGRTLAEAGPFGFVKMTPGHLELLSGQLSPEQARGLADLLVVGADAFPHTALAQWRKLDPVTPVLNEYGPTEASVANCAHEAAEPVSGSGLLPIGRPIPNTTVHVLDAALRPVAPGTPGEIYIGGVCVVRGYAGRPAATAARFLPDPFGPPGSRLYRTGDRGRWLPGGALDFLGRVDDQVKIRGHRVEPAEVEAALTSHPAVLHALVTSGRTPSGHTALAAYVVADDVDADALRAHAGRLLPAHLVPASVVRMDRFPLNENGKVDRSALPPPQWAVHDTSRPPRGVIELAIAEVWAEVLGIAPEEVDAERNFFELGGNSLLVLSLVERLRARLDTAVSFDGFFRHPTVSGVAAAVTTTETPATSCLTPLNTATGGTPLVLVHPAGGTVFCYRELVAELTDLPVLGVSLSEADHDSVEAMTGAYADEIARAVNGPVAVAGWSAGGLLAFETARQLRTRGHEVAAVVLLDPSAPGERTRWRRHERELNRILSRLRLADETTREEEFRSVVRSDLFAAMGVDPSTCDRYAHFPQQVLTTWQRQFGLLSAYDAEDYEGELTIVTPADAGRWPDTVTGPVREVRVAGDHMTMLSRPHVVPVARAVRRAVSDARA